MKLMLDQSTKKIRELRSTTGLKIHQLRTPLTQYKPEYGISYGLDNGAFTQFKARTFTRMAEAAVDDSRCLWIAVPDYPMCAYSTIGLFRHWKHVIKRKRAFVLQNDIHRYKKLIPWNEIVCVFVGGDDNFKESKEAVEIAIEARKRRKWVHVGRVNTVRRLDFWEPYAHSIDGSGIARFDHMRNPVIKYLQKTKNTTQRGLKDYGENE